MRNDWHIKWRISICFRPHPKMYSKFPILSCKQLIDQSSIRSVYVLANKISFRVPIYTNFLIY